MSDIDILKNASLFQGLDDNQIKKIAERGERRKVADGDVVFEEGEEGHEVFVVLGGRVQITVQMGHKAEQAPVHTIVEGKVFGEFSLCSDEKRTATARAMKDTVLFVFNRDEFVKWAEEDPRFGYMVMKNLSQILVGRIKKTTGELRSSLMF